MIDTVRITVICDRCTHRGYQIGKTYDAALKELQTRGWRISPYPGTVCPICVRTLTELYNAAEQAKT